MESGEIHSSFELFGPYSERIIDGQPIIEPYKFFNFDFSLPLSKSAAEYVIAQMSKTTVRIAFIETKLIVSCLKTNQQYWVTPPEEVSFSTRSKRPEPPFSDLVIQKQER